MASKSSTSTLFSTYKSSKIHRNYSRNGANSSRYIVGSVGKSCGKHINFGGESGSNSSSGSRNCGTLHQNVAIATQVLNPSAIGGSLKNRRFVEHFGRKEDDEISFLNRRSRAVCSKLCYYGISIGVTMVMITGLIVAVGYMQSEKQKVSTRPVKLAQGQDYHSSTTHLPLVILHGTTTTVKPIKRVSFDPDNELEEDGENDDMMDEISVTDFIQTRPPQPRSNHHQAGIFNFKVSTTNQHRHNIHDANDDENNIPDDNKSKFGGNSQFSNHNHDDENDESDHDDETKSPEEEDYDYGRGIDNQNQHSVRGDDKGRQFSEVRVKPPSGFKFDGISFEFPIYRTNTTTTEKSSTSTVLPDVDGDDDDEELHPNDDLSEIETESASSSSASVKDLSPTTQPTTTPLGAQEDETKGLETSIKHSNSNSGTNFTSLIDSQENNLHKEVLSSDLDDEEIENYANANIQQDANSSGSLFSQQLNPSNSAKSDSSNSNSNAKNGDDQIIVKASSGGFKTKKTQYDKNYHDDFNIGEATTAVATLQTDIFDNAEEFQASASEDSEIDVESGDAGGRLVNDEEEEERNNTPSDRVTTTRRPKPNNKNYDNGNNKNNNEERYKDTAATPQKSNKGQRRGKIVRPSPSQPPYHQEVDYDDGDEPPPPPKNNARTNNKGGGGAGGKKLSLKQKKFRGKVKGTKDKDQSTGQQNIQLEHIAISSGESLPIANLDYKVDFSRFIPTTPAPSFSLTTDNPSQDSDNIEYQPPTISHSVNPYPDFRFAPPPPERHKPFDLDEYLQKHAHKKVVDTSDDATTQSPSPPAPTINLDLSSLANFQQSFSNVADPTAASNPYASFGGISGAGGSVSPSFSDTPPSPLAFTQDNQFSPQVPTTNFGAASPTGATLNIFQSQPSYNFDGGNSGGGGGGTYQPSAAPNFNFPTFNALSSSASSNAQHGFHVDANGAFSLITPSNLPYPNIPTGQVTSDNSNNLASNNFQNAYSFTNNEPASSSKNLILTTGTGQIPTYNTITQGIHLLSLLSGRNSGGGGGYQNSNDQLSSGSSNYENIAEMYPGSQPLVQIPGLSGGGASGNFDNFQSSYPSYTQDFFPQKNFKGFDQSGDQDPSASNPIASFSQNIIMKAADLDFGMNNVKAIHQMTQMSPPTTKSSISEFQLVGLTTTPSPPPKSFALSIVPKSTSSTRKSKHKAKVSTTTTPQSMDSSELEQSVPKSRKRLMTPEPDLDVAESGIHVFATDAPSKRRFSAVTNTAFGRPGKGTSYRGLKSGFYS
ncbi:zinc-regulated protein 8 isoform X2 [Folsomia candida]|uniref:zinc-regulated protein 8 isoform X2 n=1 Tax=Folsomia candida TaxID=158441 RepID=UPI000B8FC2C1|nr:zinc-regulated protein 8 isoform X2 [Folsomia candida]